MNFKEVLLQYSSNRAVIGCQEDEIVAIEKKTGTILPKDYRQFLKQMGRSAPDFFVGSDFEYEKLSDLQEWATDLLSESDLSPLGNDAFVFMMHQGCQFYFFQNGKVNYYMEGEKEPEVRFSTFEEFFNEYAKQRTPPV